MRLIPLLAVAALLGSARAEEGWWMQEPIRWVQTNLRETDAGLDAPRLMGQLSAMRANVLLMGMGGIAAYYPTRVESHYASPYLPAGRDLFGDVLREAHARKIRVVGRFDFSKTRKAVFDAHPEWFFRRSDGGPVIYNGLYSTCINGGYYRERAMEILSEALDGYAVDGLFFNMFGNQSSDYSGRPVGLCHCAACQRKYRQLYGKEIPERPDDDYRRFMLASSREVAAAIGDLIHKKRPQAGYFNYIQDYTDGIMSESNTAVARPLPLWPYSASDHVNRARGSQPGKMAVDLNMQFVDFPWRFATVPREEIALRAWQHLANGGALTFEVNGTLDQQDRQAREAIKPIFLWAAANEQYYAGQSSAARVLLLGAPSSGGAFSEQSYRGLFRLLSEEHIPFAVSDNMDWLGKRDFDLVVAADWAPAALRQYVEGGGRALVVSARKPGFEIAPTAGAIEDMKGYARVRDHAAYPSLKEVDLLMIDGPFTELQGGGPAPLTLVPPSMIGPPEYTMVSLLALTLLAAQPAPPGADGCASSGGNYADAAERGDVAAPRQPERALADGLLPADSDERHSPGGCRRVPPREDRPHAGQPGGKNGPGVYEHHPPSSLRLRDRGPAITEAAAAPVAGVSRFRTGTSVSARPATAGGRIRRSRMPGHSGWTGLSRRRNTSSGPRGNGPRRRRTAGRDFCAPRRGAAGGRLHPPDTGRRGRRLRLRESAIPSATEHRASARSPHQSPPLRRPGRDSAAGTGPPNRGKGDFS
ncbi:MAG: hypothetical protein LAQ30_22360 [Acidobacteriia bacterium]|nr:hypothetical protein [Terriglobia bacterium]